MPYQTDDVRIKQIKELLPPIALLEKFPATKTSVETVYNARQAIHKLLNDKDSRLLVIIGPCSIHDPEAALEYAEKLVALRKKYKNKNITI